MKFEVTNANFGDLYPKMKLNLKKSDFVSIDAEFSGISYDSAPKNSLFDTSEDRYKSVRANIKNYVIIQFGMTCFQYDRDQNKYTGSSYVFYVLPLLAVKKLEFENDAADFLSEHGFDFDKLVHEGVGYLNNPEERKLRDDLMNDEMEELIQIECTHVAKWLESGNNSDPLVLFKDVDYRKKLEIFLIVRRIKKMFKSVVIYKDANGQVVVEVLDSHRQSVSEKAKTCFMDEDEFIDECIGVTKLFRLLAQLKKPIVGHNLLLDLMFMYQQWHEPLPVEYEEFKKNLHSLFPVLYDTKFLSYELRELLERDNKWESNGLSQLYAYFKEGPGFNLAPFTPSIELEGSEVNGLEEDPFHEAGWDSFCTGYCFIRMMHIFAIRKIVHCKYEPKPVVSQQHFHAVKPYMNRVNVSRAHINHMCLDGSDPTSTRPNWLIVRSINHDAVDTRLLQVHLCNVRGTFDIKTVSKNKVHIAANSKLAMTEIMNKLKEYNAWHVVPYNSRSLNTLIRVLPWIAGLSLCALLTLKMKMK